MSFPIRDCCIHSWRDGNADTHQAMGMTYFLLPHKVSPGDLFLLILLFRRISKMPMRCSITDFSSLLYVPLKLLHNTLYLCRQLPPGFDRSLTWKNDATIIREKWKLRLIRFLCFPISHILQK